MTKQKVTISRDELFSLNDIQTQWVPVPEWKPKAEMMVSTWGAHQRDVLDDLMLKTSEGQVFNMRAAVVAISVVDPETLEPIFSLEDIEQLAKKNQAPMSRLFDASVELNPLSTKIVEEAAKNSSTARSDTTS